MNMHDYLLSIQYVTITLLFAELLIVFVRWKNQIHSYLFLGCIATFISNVGYLLEMKAGSEEAYITALKLSYLGRVWIVVSFFLFTAKMCRIRLPKGLVFFLLIVHVGIYTSILDIGSSNLYYTGYQFVSDPVFPKFYHSNGILHDLFMALNVVFAVISMTWVIRSYRRERSHKAKIRFLMLLMSFGVQALSLVLQVIHAFRLTDFYDITMPGTLIGTVFILIGIFGFDLLGTREIAIDFVIDRISEGIIAVDNDGRIQYYNEPAEKLYPEFTAFYRTEQADGDPEDTGEIRDASAEKPGETVLADKSHRNPPKPKYTPYDIIAFIDAAAEAGETISLNDRIYTPEKNDLKYKGENYGRIYALVDDTEHYRYMDELQKQRDIADSANAAKSRFLASMSHEIRTPINAVLGMDEMILRESREKGIRAYASDIMSAGKNLLSLINDILDLSKVEEGKMEIIPVQYDLSSLINDLINMIRERALKKGLKFNVEADESIPNILFGDEIRIRQCAMNLLTNAVKYTEAGEVNLRVSYRESGGDHILLGITVEDTGIGMKAEDMENLFSPYKRIEEKRNRSIEGTGLGMSITRQLLELMGSTLQVKSEYGKGSVFSFEVDQSVVSRDVIGNLAARLNDRPEQLHEYHELFHAPDACILVVDDTEMNLTVIRNLLKKTGIRIDTAMSGMEAVELSGDNRYDVIFIDHMMPDMDGIETLSRIRESDRNRDIPAVALTANAVSGAREMYLEAGFTDYLSKPVDGEKLERLLANMIPAEKQIKPENDERQELDEREGLENCGSMKGYLSVLSVFHQTAAAKADEIERLYKMGDIPIYTVKVHALKSSARIIGASALSELARQLEDAGNGNDTEFIRNNTDRLLNMFRTLDEGLTWLDNTEPDEELTPIGDKELKDAYMAVVEIAGCMDFGMMQELFKGLGRFSFPEADRARFDRLEKELTELDWDGMIKTAGEGL